MSKRPPGNGNSKVPALKSHNFLINFRALIAAFDAQVKLWDELCMLWRGRNMPVDLTREADDVDDARALWTSVREGSVQCLATMKALWATGLYTIKDVHVNLPSAEWLAWRIGEMTKAWGGNVKMSADEMLYLADRLEVENLNAMTWESIFREIEDTCSKALTISEVLQFLKKTKHIANWKKRLAAVDLEQIRQKGEEIVFALEFKKSVFEAATLEYLDVHGCVDLAAAMRDDDCMLSPWECAIEGAAKSEGLSELVAKIEMQCDYSPNSELIAKLKDGYRPDLDNPFEQARPILTAKKHVMLEWDLLFKNAQRRLNQDKAFACTGCGAGYDEDRHCMICDSTVVDHAQWEQRIEQQQKKLQQEHKIEFNTYRKYELIKELVKRYNADRPWGSDDTRSDQYWMQQHINLEKPTLPSKRFIEILHWRAPNWQSIPEAKGSEGEWVWEDEAKGIGYDGVYGTADAVLSFDNPLAFYETSNKFMSAGDEYDVFATGVHYLMTTVYENTDGRKLSLKTIIPYRYEVKEVMVSEKSISYEQIGGKDQVLTEAECKTLDHLLAIKEPTPDDQTQLVELIVKLYAAFLPPPLLIRNLRSAISQRIAQGRPRNAAEQREFDLTQAEEARARALYEQTPQGQYEAWFCSLGLEYMLRIFDDDAIDETILPHLTDDMLKDLGIKVLGDRIKLLDAIAIRYKTSPINAAQAPFDAWLNSLDLGDYIWEIFRDNGIKETMFPHLTDEMLKKLGVNLYGDRIKLLDAIAVRYNGSAAATSAQAQLADCLRNVDDDKIIADDDAETEEYETDGDETYDGETQDSENDT